MTKTVDGSNLGYLIGKIRDAFWAKGDTSELTIDAVPTKGSANLVTSGGVFDALSNNAVVVSVLPTASASTLGKIYLVGPDGDGEYDRYQTTYDGNSYSWAPLGSTEIHLTDLENLLGKVVAHHKETYTDSGSLAVNSGGQTVNWDYFNWRPGHKYAITVESDTNNTGYLRFFVWNKGNTPVQITSNVSQNINGNPYTYVYEPTENMGRLQLYIRTIAAAGTVTLNVTEEWDEVLDHLDEGELVAKLGKNLADPGKLINPGRISIISGSTEYILLHTGTLYATDYIPIKSGQSLTCNQPSNSNTYNSAALFRFPGDLIPISGTVVTVNTTATRTITNNLGYDAYAVFNLWDADHTAEVQVEAGSAVTFYEPYDPLYGYTHASDVDYSSFGAMARYKDEIDMVLGPVANNHLNAHKLHFVHVSDNHGQPMGEADVFTDPSPAAFLVNTGDLVADKYADSYDTTKNAILAMTKPGYVTLGNHDCYLSDSLASRFSKFIDPLNTHNGLTGNTKTYYSVDFATEKVKCIFLDMNDGYDSTSALAMNVLVAGKMSQAQINWFASELQAAKTSGYDVAAFIHVSPDYIDPERKIDAFTDAQVAKGTGVAFLADMVDGFINGGTVTFTADGISYTFTFTAGGAFAGWFCGHTHYDGYGWLKDHPKQFSCSVARPFKNNDATDGTYRQTALGVTWDYVTINANTHTMSVLRMGNQETIYGTKREAFYVKY